MNHSYFLKGTRISLYPLKAAELEQMRSLRNQKRHCFISSEIITAAEQRKWYESYLDRENDYLFSIYINEKWIGTVSIYNVDPVGAKAEFGRLMIDREAAGSGGLGVEATRMACRIAFERLGIHRVTLEVYVDNIPAQITYLKAGFIPVELILDGEGQKLLRMECQIS